MSHGATDLVVGTMPYMPVRPDDFSEQGMIATTMRVVNAIPYVCAAAPGLDGPLPRAVASSGELGVPTCDWGTLLVGYRIC